MLVYQLRKTNPYLVNAVFVKDSTVEDICARFYQLTLYIEYIPVRLSDVSDIPYPDALHLIESCLRGFAVLYKKGGYFKIEEDLVGFNSSGKTKVWINSQL